MGVSNGQFRTWACILYPDDDSFPLEYFSIIRSWHVPYVLSPLHSPDCIPQSGEADYNTHLKRHYHLYLYFAGKKSQSGVNELLDDLGKAHTLPFKLDSSSGYIRYMVHLGYPEKEQFLNSDASPEEYMSLLAYNLDAEDLVKQAFEIGDFDQYKIISDINHFIIENDITEFEDLMTYCILHQPKWEYVLNKFPCRPVYALLSSRRFRRSN